MRVPRYGAYPRESNARTFAGWETHCLPWVVCDLVEARVVSSHASESGATEQSNALNNR